VPPLHAATPVVEVVDLGPRARLSTALRRIPGRQVLPQDRRVVASDLLGEVADVRRADHDLHRVSTVTVRRFRNQLGDHVERRAVVWDLPAEEPLDVLAVEALPGRVEPVLAALPPHTDDDCDVPRRCHDYPLADTGDVRASVHPCIRDRATA
jgi:hypothetical protein